jgi:hypothetical protein
MKNPAGIPTMLAMRVEMELTFKETWIIWRSSWSKPQRSKNAERKLSVNNSISLVSVVSFSVLDVRCEM